MKLLIPTALTDAMLISTNVHETAPALWLIGTTYAAGDFRHVVNGIKLDIYESLSAGNVGNAPASSPTKWVYRSFTYPAYAIGTTYALGDRVIVAATHKIYESLVAGESGNAVTDTTKWVLVGATNPWTSYDAKVGSQTERTGSIYFELDAGVVEGIAFFNLYGASVTVKLTVPSYGVFEQTISLISTSNRFDGYSYFFAPFLLTRHTAMTGIPPLSGTLEITISAGSDTETAKCGEIVFGRIRDIGGTLYAPSFEIQSFSRKERDTYGNFEVVPGAFSNRIPIDVMMENSRLNFMKQTLEDYESTPVVCITTEKEFLMEAFLVYGYYRTARTVASYPNNSILSIEWEGLI